MTIQKETIAVSGMSCSGCARTVEKSVKGKQGVRSADVDLAGKKVIVEFDPDAVSLKDIEAAIKDAGYTVEKTK